MSRITSSAIARYWIGQNARGLTLVFLLFAAISTLLLLLPAYLASPVLARAEVPGKIVSVSVSPVNPKVAIGGGFHYEYGVRVSDGRVVFARGPISQPRMVSDLVTLTESRHENGRVSYRFVVASRH